MFVALAVFVLLVEYDYGPLVISWYLLPFEPTSTHFGDAFCILGFSI